MNFHTIFAPATTLGKAAVSVIRVSGSQCVSILEKMCTNPPKVPRKMSLTNILHPKHTKLLDKALVVHFPAPHSYTGEDSIEFHLHGSLAIQRAMFDALAYFPNCRMAEKGEFTQRAFLNSKIGLAEAENLKDLINAETEQQRLQAMLQFQGGTEKVYEEWLQSLLRSVAYLEASIDFGETEQLDDTIHHKVHRSVSKVLQEIQNHLNDARSGEILKQGIKSTIYGFPNVGKSTLLNYLSRKNAAMVTAYPGTTRDIIETHVDIGGYPVHLGDTAGLRETKDPIEQQGIQLAKERLRTSQLKIGVLAASSLSELLHQWQTLQPHFDSSTVIVLNKVDTPLSYPVPSEIPIDAYISLKNMIGLDTFQTKLVNVLSSKYPPTVSLQERHVTELQMAIQQLTHFLSKSNFDIVMGMENLKQAHFHLGRLVGKNVNIEDILDIVFRDFCIGK